MHVLQIEEIRMIIISSGLKLMANGISVNEIGASSTFYKNEEQYLPYFFGGCLSMLLGGILHDVLSNGKTYLVIVAINVITITW